MITYEILNAFLNVGIFQVILINPKKSHYVACVTLPFTFLTTSICSDPQRASHGFYLYK